MVFEGILVFTLAETSFATNSYFFNVFSSGRSIKQILTFWKRQDTQTLFILEGV